MLVLSIYFFDFYSWLIFQKSTFQINKYLVLMQNQMSQIGMEENKQ